MSQLKTALQALAAQAKANNIHRMAEMQVQSSYVVEVLKLLGWKDSDWKLGAAQGTNTGKFPDISLHDRNKHTVLVVECKDAKKADKLDGRYGNKTFVEQLYGYCRAEGINWGILTNFVEWRLYNDVQGRLYQNKKYAFMDLLWPGANPNSYVDILSDEGLAFLMKFQRTPLCSAKGKVDDDPLYYPIEKQIEDTKAKFFVKLKGWRDSLRKELHKNYWEKYDKDQIDLFTQKILDRMIFIEVCHDKDIIGQDVHRAILSSKDDKYHELKKWFKEMDEQFNTELFAPMAIDHFDIDDKVLVPIIEELNGIDFKNVSVHIIGEVYENYLGEMLRVTKKSGLKVQEHKEQAKRKSQGIYYTPEYIVDYIVKNTVGELLDLSLNPSPGRGGKQNPTRGKGAMTTEEIMKIKVLDPACGSGSFLIKAFDLFLQAYRRAAAGKQTSFYSDLEIKKKILQHNLYGVDLDDRAVEITKLNLMLKALDGINYHELKGRKLLPNLNLNIRVGNSLISGQTIEQLAEKQTAPTFPGLDDTININPLLKLHNAFYKEVEDEEKARLIKEIEVEERRLNRKLGDNLKGFSNLDEIKPLNYQVAFPEVSKQGGFDAVIGNPPYIQQSMIPGFSDKSKTYLLDRYCSSMGRLNTFGFFIQHGIELLKNTGKFSYIVPNTLLTQEYYNELRRFILSNTTINYIAQYKDMQFEDAVVENITLVLTKVRNEKNVLEVVTFENGIIKESQKVVQNKYLNTYSNQFAINIDSKEEKLKDKLLFGGVCLLNKVANINQAIALKYDRSKSIFSEKENDNYKPVLDGRDIERYTVKWPGNYLKYDVNAIHSCKREDIFIADNKIFFRRVGDKIIATLDKNKHYALNTLIVVTLKPDAKVEYEYLLGLLNSKLLNFYYVKYLKSSKKVFSEIQARQIEQLPIILPSNREQKGLHDKLVKLVKEMLKLNKTPELRQRHSADIAVIDKEIDELVYRLYGLSEAEKKVVEGI
ncbi:MAG: Eco57I restriction-modification methylase domain-containing protein [Desulfocucumaceae bacterium]